MSRPILIGKDHGEFSDRAANGANATGGRDGRHNGPAPLRTNNLADARKIRSATEIE
jgi:hypothetical protein